MIPTIAPAITATPLTVPPAAVINTHPLDRETCRRRTSHCIMPTDAPTTAPVANKDTAIYSQSMTNQPTVQPTAVANTHWSQKDQPTGVRVERAS
jgi:hypothetical protein